MMTEKRNFQAERDLVEIVKGWRADIARLEKIKEHLGEDAKARAQSTIENLFEQLWSHRLEIEVLKWRGYKID